MAVRSGAACWPGVTHLLLLEVDAGGNLTGGAEIVCRACAREAAARVLDRLDELEATCSCRQDLPYLDPVGEFSPPEGPCSICGDCP